jgi:NadR type nicotinamide-nucleotide adenylyltransferase
MAQKMAERFHTRFVPEVAREMITSNHFNREDIIAIGRTQTERIFAEKKKANRVLFCDTDLITTQVYSRQYLKVVPPVLYEFEKMVTYDEYFLFSPDVPWVADGLRDLGDEEKRHDMYTRFREELQQRNIVFVPVEGYWEQREQIVVSRVNEMLNRSM